MDHDQVHKLDPGCDNGKGSHHFPPREVQGQIWRWLQPHLLVGTRSNLQQALWYWEHQSHKISQWLAQHWTPERPIWQTIWMPLMRMARRDPAPHVPVHEPWNEAHNESFLSALKKYYHRHKIPAVVYIPFLKMCKAAYELEELKWPDHLSPTIRQAIKNQQTVAREFLLPGYLTVNWPAATQENHPDKPGLLLSHLYVGIWKTLFSSIWEQWNTIAHSDEGMITKIEGAQLLLSSSNGRDHTTLG